MDEAKLEAVRQLYRALDAGDKDGVLAALHPGFVGQVTEGLPLGLGGRYEGAERMQEDLWWRVGQHIRAQVDAEDFRMLDDGRIFVAGYYRGVARATGNRLDAAFVHVIGFSDDGRINSLVQLTDSALWFAALGSQIQA